MADSPGIPVSTPQPLEAEIPVPHVCAVPWIDGGYYYCSKLDKHMTLHLMQGGSAVIEPWCVLWDDGEMSFYDGETQCEFFGKTFILIAEEAPQPGIPAPNPTTQSSTIPTSPNPQPAIELLKQYAAGMRTDPVKAEKDRTDAANYQAMLDETKASQLGEEG